MQTEDLLSYIPGYDEWLEEQDENIDYDEYIDSLIREITDEQILERLEKEENDEQKSKETIRETIEK